MSPRAPAGWCVSSRSRRRRLATEAVEGAALAFEGVDDVHGGDGLAAGVLGVGDGVADDGLHEGLEDATSLLAVSRHAQSMWSARSLEEDKDTEAARAAEGADSAS